MPIKGFCCLLSFFFLVDVAESDPSNVFCLFSAIFRKGCPSIILRARFGRTCLYIQWSLSAGKASTYYWRNRPWAGSWGYIIKFSIVFSWLTFRCCMDNDILFEHLKYCTFLVSLVISIIFYVYAKLLHSSNQAKFISLLATKILVRI